MSPRPSGLMAGQRPFTAQIAGSIPAWDAIHAINLAPLEKVPSSGGGLPKNLVKVKSIVGEDKVKSCKILTASDAAEKIGENSFVSNLIDL